MVHIQRNLGELYRGRTAMGLKYIVAGLSVMAKSDVSARNSLHITPIAYSNKLAGCWMLLKMNFEVFSFMKKIEIKISIHFARP